MVALVKDSLPLMFLRCKGWAHLGRLVTLHTGTVLGSLDPFEGGENLADEGFV